MNIRIFQNPKEDLAGDINDSWIDYLGEVIQEAKNIDLGFMNGMSYEPFPDELAIWMLNFKGEELTKIVGLAEELQEEGIIVKSIINADYCTLLITSM